MQTLLEAIQPLDATTLRHLTDVHVVADARHAVAYLCINQPSDASGSTHLIREVLPVGLDEQLKALAASELVGRLHVIVLRHGGAEREFHLLAKTHAGSATERALGRRSLA